MKRISVFSVLAFFLVGTAYSADLEVHRLPDSVHRMSRFINANCLVSRPGNVNKESKLPLLTFLHGAGGRGEEIERLTVYPDEGHGASRRVYSTREFFEWIFAQNAAVEQDRPVHSHCP